MKALSMPISSPSRAESFPPPLTRLLRSNIRGKSRGKSRSTPIFYIRGRRNGASVIEITQEPSSPKVTCIGQVKSGGAAVHRRRRCWLLRKALFCAKLSSRFHRRKRVFKRIFCKWVLFLRSGYCKKVDAEDDSFCKQRRSKHSENPIAERESYSKKDKNFGVGIQERERERDFLDDCSSPPPKNALILTRCRSAPYRSSSLLGRFWAENDAKSNELQNLSCENDDEISRIGQESGNETENSVENVEELRGIMLTRCKSEPAGRGERLNPEPISGLNEDSAA